MHLCWAWLPFIALTVLLLPLGFRLGEHRIDKDGKPFSGAVDWSWNYWRVVTLMLKASGSSHGYGGYNMLGYWPALSMRHISQDRVVAAADVRSIRPTEEHRKVI